MSSRPPSDHARAAQILVVDDEASIRDLVTTALEFVGYKVRAASDGYECLAAVTEQTPDLIVLDVNMPGIDGLEVCRRLRDAGDTTPVIFLTARDAVDDTVAGFASGGDDYLTKPFHLKVLVARVQAVLKRAGQPGAGSSGRLTCGGIQIEEATHRVWRDGERVDLSPTEYRLLRYLMRNAGVVVSKAQILEQVWHYDFDGDASVVETYISTLRRKVDRSDDRLIHTVRGFGYVIRAEDEQ
jgi:two-component system, OmpR family, response regulator